MQQMRTSVQQIMLGKVCTGMEQATSALDAVKNAGRPVCVLPNYTAMLAVRDKLSSLAGGGKFWEAN